MVVLAGDSSAKDAKKGKQAAKAELSGKDTEESGGNGDESGSSDSDDSVPALEENDAEEGRKPVGGAGGDDAGNIDLSGGNVHLAGRQSRGEKKARKTLMKLGLKPVPGINRVTIRKSKNILFVIQSPDVYRHPGSDHYVIFGEAKIEDLSHQAQLQSLERLKNPDFLGEERKGLESGAGGHSSSGDKADSKDTGPSSTTKIEDSDNEEGGELDESGLDSNDVNLVMTQAGVKRSRAVKALKRNDGDIVNAIMELTMSGEGTISRTSRRRDWLLSAMGNQQAQQRKNRAVSRPEVSVDTSDGEERTWRTAAADSSEEQHSNVGQESFLTDESSHSRSPSSASPLRQHKSRFNGDISSRSQTDDENRHGLQAWDDEGFCDTNRIHQDIDMLFSYLDGWPDPDDSDIYADNTTHTDSKYPSTKTSLFSGMSTLEETEEEAEEEESEVVTAPPGIPVKDLSKPEVTPTQGTQGTDHELIKEHPDGTTISGPSPFEEKVAALQALLSHCRRNPSAALAREDPVPLPPERTMQPDCPIIRSDFSALRSDIGKSERTSPTPNKQPRKSPMPLMYFERELPCLPSAERYGSSPKTKNDSAFLDILSRSQRKGDSRPACAVPRPRTVHEIPVDYNYKASSDSRTVTRQAAPKKSLQGLQEGDVVSAVYSYRNSMPGTISFAKGQSGVVMRLNSGGWCYVCLRDCEGWAPVNYWQSLVSRSISRSRAEMKGEFEEDAWMWGYLSRPDCTFLLLSFGREGDFLIRNSSVREGEFTLSVRHLEVVHHFAIKVNAVGAYTIGNLTFQFAELADIVAHYQQHTILQESFAVLENPFCVRFE
ncbi:putative Nascent polypeptide-associated complex subunit alpha-like protein 1 [Hypsibius exemplaris]|uniref:Nascent polypeptide-associated complex subunit alpha-like protein 1 n=1 Tax=Hypsibius exemplaris TaxID=2072580 RepID=A0A1W0X2Q7_HYPEX|nr:putative Nascent polypeptide-associated complex subunit alpha-like protein 1 [Hypsibius exemplaris]